MVMEQKFPFIIFEAIDGVGKSSIAKMLGSELGAMNCTSPQEPFRSYRNYFDKSDPRVRFLFYLSANLALGKNIEKWTLTTPVVCDRYLLSTLAAHEVRGVPKHWFELMSPIIKQIYPPDLVVLLECDENVRLQRLTQRGLSEVDKENLRLGLGPRLFDGYQRWAEKLGFKTVRFNNTHFTAETSSDAISNLVLHNFPRLNNR